MLGEVYLTSQEQSKACLRAEALVVEYQTKIARYVRRMVSDSEVALDITQDVFLAAYRILQAEPERPLTPGWLYRAASNAAISHLRRRKIVRMLPLGPEHDARSTWRIDEQSSVSMDLQAALANLPTEQATAVMLTSYAGYSSQEAAEMVGTTADAIRQRVCRAMKTLRSVMTE